jgi:hypothetical protein
MKLVRFLGLVGWIFCCVVAGAQGLGSISGSVIDVDGVPSAGAVVTLTSEALAEKRQATLGARWAVQFCGRSGGKV